MSVGVDVNWLAGCAVGRERNFTQVYTCHRQDTKGPLLAHTVCAALAIKLIRLRSPAK